MHRTSRRKIQITAMPAIHSAVVIAIFLTVESGDEVVGVHLFVSAFATGLRFNLFIGIWDANGTIRDSASADIDVEIEDIVGFGGHRIICLILLFDVFRRSHSQLLRLCFLVMFHVLLFIFSPWVAEGFSLGTLLKMIPFTLVPKSLNNTDFLFDKLFYHFMGLSESSCSHRDLKSSWSLGLWRCLRRLRASVPLQSSSVWECHPVRNCVPLFQWLWGFYLLIGVQDCINFGCNVLDAVVLGGACSARPRLWMAWTSSKSHGR
ncbi:hypothetical protein BFJ63_vAg519 [Fusarium oxysporum f. sp. narcissi]|uniref:Uncharacterized protein n=3 Tax=Fusarium oxysporum TaxID=5507 RepID=A0A2H3HRB7_FUSOX|nr:hypothetical protein AU210_000311 [Fusarium oxysporum f. sp. radicis-cucumerinum]RYC96660.1 hypothetical protein BFJ63_vAg519 [Fusarium oxysporum f. sp. narcissi]